MRLGIATKMKAMMYIRMFLSLMILKRTRNTHPTGEVHLIISERQVSRATMAMFLSKLPLTSRKKLKMTSYKIVSTEFPKHLIMCML